MSIRRLSRAGAVGVGVAALVLTGSAFSVTSAHHHAASKRDSHRTAHRSARVQPGGPLVANGGGRQAPEFGNRSSALVSRNWGGYAVSKSGTKFRGLKTTFFVPYVDCAASPNSFSGHWVGLDGLSNGTVEQDGILAACQGSTPTYAAWYEMFPLPPVYPNIHIFPGNSIQVSVYYSTHSRKFMLTVRDTTNGQHFTVARGCPSGSSCERSSAEVISEAPSNGTSVLPLTDFRAVGYLGTSITGKNAHETGGLRSSWWHTSSITTVNGVNQVIDQPTSVYRGSAFDMYWMGEN